MRPQGEHTYGIINDVIICRRGGIGQHYAGFASAARLTAHHDADLAALTEQINQLIREQEYHADGRRLAVLSTPDGFFLAWTKNEHEKTFDDEDMAGRSDLVTIDSDDDLIRERLGLH